MAERLQVRQDPCTAETVGAQRRQPADGLENVPAPGHVTGEQKALPPHLEINVNIHFSFQVKL